MGAYGRVYRTTGGDGGVWRYRARIYGPDGGTLWESGKMSGDPEIHDPRECAADAAERAFLEMEAHARTLSHPVTLYRHGNRLVSPEPVET